MNQSQDYKAVEQFMKLLAENGRPGQARDMSFLLLYMANMSRQFDAVLQELQEVKAQLAQARESPAKKAVKSMTDFLEDQAHSARDALGRFREKIHDCAASAVEGFKTAGVSALDKAVSAMRVKTALESLQKKLGGMIDGTEKNMAKVENIGRELRSAGSHMKNAGRTAIGSPVPQMRRDRKCLGSTRRTTHPVQSGRNPRQAWRKLHLCVWRRTRRSWTGRMKTPRRFPSSRQREDAGGPAKNAVKAKRRN